MQLPILASGAPSGLPDPNETPPADRLLWDCWLADPSGSIDQVLANSFNGLTRWSQRTLVVTSPFSGVEDVGLGTLARMNLKFRLTPNPGRTARDIYWAQALPVGQPVSWSVVDLSGRRRATGAFRASGTYFERQALHGVERLPSGIYWVQLLSGDRSGSMPMVVTR